LLAEWLPKVCVGRVRGGGQQRFVVATQTIEVGANLDFDAMVTESAPLSSLRQRCGRLDRLGELGNCHAVILHRVSRGMDSVYGEALPATWDWLTSVANESCVDFGIGALEHLMLSSPPPVDEPRHAPRLLPTHLHLMQQTGPLAPKIYVAPFLHGAARPSAEVSVVWRADLDHIHMSDWARAVAYRPPLNSETLELPLPAVRLWLADEIVGEVTDLVTHTASEVGQDMRPVLRWRGPDSTEVVQASALRPGDTVVVPASYGGCDKFGWSPRSKDAVSDIGDLCSAVAVKGHVVRLIEPLMGWADAHKKELSKLAEHYLDVLNSVDPIMGVDQSLLAEVEVAIRERISQIETPVVRALGTKYFLETYPGGLLFRRNRLEGIAGAITGGRAVALDAHVAGVAQWCQKLAEHHPECTPLTRAARFHDEGKRDGRFQVMLYGDPLLAALGPPLAKSGLRGSTALGSSWRASGLPNGFRHELVSLDTEPNLTSLERHLVGTHHGYGRPWFPRCEDASASGVAQGRLGSGWAEQFFTLNQKNGPWKVAGMESLLRAADARRSMEEQDDD
jgi:CRISPR-associated endonuclease/helicase Cas3